MTLSIKKKNGSKTKTRKRILKSKKNILRGGAEKAHFGKKLKAPAAPAAPRSEPAPKSGMRRVLNSVPQKVTNLGEKVTKTVATVGKQAGTEVAKIIFARAIKKAKEETEAKARLGKFLKAVQETSPGEPKTITSIDKLMSM